MSQWRPCKRNNFVRRLRQLGFVGLYSDRSISSWFTTITASPFPSNKDYSVPQLRMMIREVERIVGREIPLDEWESL